MVREIFGLHLSDSTRATAACSPTSFALRALAIWRVTHLIVAEDGPGDMVVRVRRAAGSSLLGQAMDCFYCSSIWVALPFAVGLTRTSGFARATEDSDHRLDVVMRGATAWLALSGAACLLEQATRGVEWSSSDDEGVTPFHSWSVEAIPRRRVSTGLAS
jgi:hypothetical protein